MSRYKNKDCVKIFNNSSVKKKVAIVRGSFFAKWEMQTYEHLLKDFNFTAFTTFHSHYHDINNVKLPIQRLHSINEIVSKLPKFKGIINNQLNKIIGSDYLIGLENRLKDFNIVHSRETYTTASYQSILAKKKYGFKVVLRCSETIPFNYENKKLLKRNKEVAVKNTDLFIATTERARRALIFEGINEARVVVLPVGIDISKFYPKEKNQDLLKKFGVRADNIVVLFIGRLVWEKGIFDLIEVARKSYEDRELKDIIKILVFGDGPEKSRMTQFIKRLNLKNIIRIYPKFSYKYIPGIHNIADIFVLPSVPTSHWEEQFGVVLAESMACGKAVISTTSGSIPETIGDSGVLIHPNDYKSLYNQIKKLALNSSERRILGQKARQRAESKFDSKKIAQKIKAIYNGL